MVRLHPVCPRKPALALRLVSGRHDGIRTTVSSTSVSLRQPLPDLVAISGGPRNVAQAVGCKEGRSFAQSRQPLTVSRPADRSRAGRADERLRAPRSKDRWHGLCSMGCEWGPGLPVGPAASGASTTRRCQRFRRVDSAAGGSPELHRAKQGCRPLRVPGAVICKADFRHFCSHADRG
jgi:hypothetical protein